MVPPPLRCLLFLRPGILDIEQWNVCVFFPFMGIVVTGAHLRLHIYIFQTLHMHMCAWEGLLLNGGTLSQYDCLLKKCCVWSERTVVKASFIRNFGDLFVDSLQYFVNGTAVFLLTCVSSEYYVNANIQNNRRNIEIFIQWCQNRGSGQGYVYLLDAYF